MMWKLLILDFLAHCETKIHFFHVLCTFVISNCFLSHNETKIVHLAIAV